MEWLEALVLGVVQGITEFLPVSSDGHLLVTQKAFEWLTGTVRSGDENLFVIVMLHLGTLAAILYFYRRTIFEGLGGLRGSTDVPSGFRRAELIRVGVLAAIATSPLIPLALFFKKRLEAAFESDTAAGYGFLITAAVLLLTSWLNRRDGAKGPMQTTSLDALLIGLAQMVAPLPGVSRSGLTIAAALALGLSRTWAVGFSLLIAVPAISGGALFEIRHVTAANLTPDRLAQTVVATVLAGVVGYFAIVCLVKVVKSGRIWWFAIYLIALAAIVLATVGGRTHPASAG
jgi:undecaprenyl-diphosphatase